MAVGEDGFCMDLSEAAGAAGVEADAAVAAVVVVDAAAVAVVVVVVERV
jgi:hypothetical protein